MLLSKHAAARVCLVNAKSCKQASLLEVLRLNITSRSLSHASMCQAFRIKQVI